VTFLTSPIEWWIDPFSDAFMREVLALGLLLVLATSVVGTWVVLRGMSFLGDALAHGVVPGIAIAFVLGTSTTVGALIAALAMVSGVSLIRTHSPLPEDTSIGVLFVGFLALGVVVISSHTESYAGDLTRFLFGSVSGVTSDDLVRQAAAAAIDNDRCFVPDCRQPARIRLSRRSSSDGGDVGEAGAIGDGDSGCDWLSCGPCRVAR
jgi:ABC-type Mn2+/Zn2+ transport system permease subunit